MLATSHSLTAGVILRTIPDPRIALPLAFISHFVLDLIPHWDLNTSLSLKNHGTSTLVGEKNRFTLTFKVALDVLLGLGLTFWLFRDLEPVTLLLSIFIAQSPDWLETPYYFLGINFAPSIWIKKMQHKFHSRLALPWGLVTQIVFLIILLWWAFR